MIQICQKEVYQKLENDLKLRECRDDWSNIEFEPESANRIYWSARNRFKNSLCLACPAIGGCGGGCRAISYHHSGDLVSRHPYCEDIKKIIKDIVEDLNNGLLNDYKDFLLQGGNIKNKKIF
ncbi:MAG TPA: SPASM domain-containing protein [Candidatus Moranbacteria bacterium]|nr:SPASM domain-containing protein [Candidatus Moranbacteria bacterium]HSA08418.1 SPASM domain-containing protein [Candidatus Moranbacteria bacterium]